MKTGGAGCSGAAFSRTVFCSHPPAIRQGYSGQAPTPLFVRKHYATYVSCTCSAAPYRSTYIRELLPEIGKIGAQVGLLAGGSFNPWKLDRGGFAGGYIDLPLKRIKGGKLSYEILVGLSQSKSEFETTSQVAAVANLAAGASLADALAGAPNAPFPTKRMTRTRLRLLFGVALWTLGALGVAHVVSAAFLNRFPGLTEMVHGAGLAVFAVGLMVAGLTYARGGVSPFKYLRESLSAVRDGKSPRVEGSYPNEVQPLVDDLNALLDHREHAVRRAQAKAGDLAPGLKTPLSLLAREAEEAAAQGHLGTGSRDQPRGEPDATSSGLSPGTDTCRRIGSVGGRKMPCSGIRGGAFTNIAPPLCRPGAGDRGECAGRARGSVPARRP